MIYQSSNGSGNSDDNSSSGNDSGETEDEYPNGGDNNNPGGGGDSGGGDDDGGDTGGGDSGGNSIDYSSLRLRARSIQTEQLQNVGIYVPTNYENLMIRMSVDCPGENLRYLTVNTCEDGYCADLTCNNSGVAIIEADVYMASVSEYKPIIQADSQITFTAINKTNKSVSIANIPKIDLNAKHTASVSVPSEFSNDDNYSYKWSVDNTNCSLSSASVSSVNVRCTEPGSYSLSYYAESLRYTGNTSKPFQVGNPEVDFSVLVGANGEFSSINVTVPSMGWYTVKVSGLEGVDFDLISWGDGGNPACEFENDNTTGVTAKFRCTERPASGKVSIRAAIEDSYYTGVASIEIPVNRGTMDVDFSGLTSKQIEENQSLTASIKIDGSEVSASDYTFRWTVCSGSGEAGTVIEKTGTKSLSTGTACEKSGSKTFKLEVFNANFSGSKQKSVNITEDYDYFWATGGKGFVTTTILCRNINKGTCSEANYGQIIDCCNRVGTGIEPKVGDYNINERPSERGELRCLEPGGFTCSRTLK